MLFFSPVTFSFFHQDMECMSSIVELGWTSVIASTNGVGWKWGWVNEQIGHKEQYVSAQLPSLGYLLSELRYHTMRKPGYLNISILANRPSWSSRWVKKPLGWLQPQPISDDNCMRDSDPARPTQPPELWEIIMKLLFFKFKVLSLGWFPI